MALKVKVGSYAGNGTSKSITGLGFALNSGSHTMLIIKGGANLAQVGTSEMGSTKMQDITGSTPATGRLTSYDADGFTVSSNAKVNTSGTTYHYLAITDTTGTAFRTGTYAGNATGPRGITGLGFAPDFLGIWDDLGDTGGWRTSDMATDSYLPYSAGALLTDRILSLDSGGFTVSFRNEVNGTGRNYYWAAMDTTSGQIKPLTYTGNGSDNRSITGAGFQPDVSMVKDGAANAMAIRFSTETGDNSFLMTATGEAANIIQALETNGFQVGTAANVNTNTNTYYSLSLKNTTGSAQTITPSFVSRSAAIYAPTITKKRTITPSFISRSPGIYAPTVKGIKVITPSFVARTSLAYNPSAQSIKTILPAFISRTATVYAPALHSTRIIIPNFATRSAVVFLPIVHEQDTIVPPLVDRSAAVYQPTITKQFTITPSEVTHNSVVYQPTITVIAPAQTITPNRISRSAVAYAPMIVSVYTISPNKITRSAAVYQPTLSVSAVTITVGFISRSPVVYVPTLHTIRDISPAKISRTFSVYTPTLRTAYIIAPPAVMRTPMVYQPQVINMLQIIYPPFVSMKGKSKNIIMLTDGRIAVRLSSNLYLPI